MKIPYIKIVRDSKKRQMAKARNVKLPIAVDERLVKEAGKQQRPWADIIHEALCGYFNR